MASNIDTSLGSEKLQIELPLSCDKDDAATENTTSPSNATKKKKSFLSSLKATPLFSSSPLVNIATNIKNSLHSSRDSRSSKTQSGEGSLHPKSSRPLPKQEMFPSDSPVSPVLLRQRTPTNTPKLSFKKSSTLFDPEEEEPIGPLFGVLRLTPSRDELRVSCRESDISSVASVTSSKLPTKGFLDRIKSSFGSRLSFGSATSRSTNTDSTVWWSKIGARSLRESSSMWSPSPVLSKRRNTFTTFLKRSSSKVTSPSERKVSDHGVVERGNSLAAFFRKSNPNPVRSRKQNDISRSTARSSKRSKSLDINRKGRTLRPISINADLDFRDFGLSTERGSFEDRDPEASLSWIWQEMGEKKIDTKMGFEDDVETARVSGDSGIGRSLSKDANYNSPEQVFGSIPELDDDVFLDIFKTEPKVPSSNLSPSHGSWERIKARNGIGTDQILHYKTHEIEHDQELKNRPSYDKGGNKNEEPIYSNIQRKTGNIQIRTNPRAIRTQAGVNQTNGGLEDKEGRSSVVRNPIRTNPNTHWPPTSSEKNTEKVTSI